MRGSLSQLARPRSSSSAFEPGFSSRSSKSVAQLAISAFMSRVFCLASLSSVLLASSLVACDRPAKKAAPVKNKDQEKSAKADEKHEGSKEAKDKKKGSEALYNGAEGKKAANDAPSYKRDEKLAKTSIKFKPPFDGTPEITTTYKNGLIAEDYVLGTGIPADKGSRLAIHYTGYLLDGTIFDSSVEKKRPPFLFELGQGRVIKGWEQGIGGMKKGGKRKLIIPAELAYGAAARGQIPSNSKLVFTLEMMEVRPPMPPPQADEVFKTKPVARKRTKSGIRITDYKIGEGELAEVGDTVFVHYTGRLKDGTVFDSSVANKRPPFSFSLGYGRVIKGWNEGIQGMKVGGLRRLKIPPALAYGEQARGQIPANATLDFTVELMDVRKPAKPAKPAETKDEKAKK